MVFGRCSGLCLHEVQLFEKHNKNCIKMVKSDVSKETDIVFKTFLCKQETFQMGKKENYAGFFLKHFFYTPPDAVASVELLLSSGEGEASDTVHVC